MPAVLPRSPRLSGPPLRRRENIPSRAWNLSVRICRSAGHVRSRTFPASPLQCFRSAGVPPRSTCCGSASRISSLHRRLRATGGFDILLTHAPIRGLGDEDHPSHRGFECFGPLLDRYRPAVMVHGHMHQAYTPFFRREHEYHGVPVYNASTAYEFDLPETPDRREPTRRGLRIPGNQESLLRNMQPDVSFV